MIERSYYKILLVGASGRGKTYSFRNMNKEKTLFINVENKPLPFKGNFKYHVVPNTPSAVLQALVDGSKNPDIECIVVDSFSAYVDMLMAEARATKRGFDVFNYYNENIGKFNDYVKKVKKEVFVTGHYEIISDELGGSKERRLKVKGKEWEGVVEKDYTVVLFAESKPKENSRPEHYFTVVNDGTNSAKCPPDLLGEDVLTITNDAQIIFNKIQEYVK
jgi:hypothetical protein